MSVEQKLKDVGNNQKHLNEHSYKTAEKLNVRILTHQKYTKPKVEFYDWVLDQIDWKGDEVVFDIGCGSGLYAAKVTARSARYWACDLSLGMLLDGPAPEFECVNLDAMQIPLPDNVADVVMANHMMYHVPDQAKAAAEFRRITKPTGKLIVVTNSNDSLGELRDLRAEAIQTLVPNFPKLNQNIASTFKLEDGDIVLRTAFNNVETRVLESWLVFTEPQPIIDYIGSSRDWYEKVLDGAVSWPQIETALRRILDEHFSKHAEFRVSKKPGAFICW